MGKSSDTPLPLSAAILRWFDPTLVEDVRKHERLCSRYELNYWSWPILVPDAELRQPTGTDWMAGGSSALPGLRDAWAKIENEFRRLVRAGELHLSGVLVKPELTTEPQLIPGAWVSELKFDLIGDAAVLFPRKFANIVVSKHAPPANAVGFTRIAGGSRPYTAENIGELSDTEVFDLVENYAQRVLKRKEVKLFNSRVSFMPIIKRKMLLRFDEGESCETLGAEAAELAIWIADKVTSLQIPDAPAIENALREVYRSAKASSTGIKT